LPPVHALGVDMNAITQMRGLMFGQSFADAEEIRAATRVATRQLNLRAQSPSQEGAELTVLLVPGGRIAPARST
jgi:hypothetical protein